jgi:hypothetical protein
MVDVCVSPVRLEVRSLPSPESIGRVAAPRSFTKWERVYTHQRATNIQHSSTHTESSQRVCRMTMTTRTRVSTTGVTSDSAIEFQHTDHHAADSGVRAYNHHHCNQAYRSYSYASCTVLPICCLPCVSSSSPLPSTSAEVTSFTQRHVRYTVAILTESHPIRG